MEKCKKEAIQSLILYLIIIFVVGYLTLNTLFWQQVSNLVATDRNDFEPGRRNELWLVNRKVDGLFRS